MLAHGQVRRVQFTDHFCRVADHDGIFGNVLRDHGPGADDGIVTDRDTLGDQCAVADPHVVAQHDRRGAARREDAVVNVVPVRVREVAVHGQHAAVADLDAGGRRHPDARVDDGVVADVNAAQCLEIGQPYGLVRQRHEMDVIADRNARP